jgi:DNA polymerase I-like protein with 3'-5' exonuclease and polymerase domains
MNVHDELVIEAHASIAEEVADAAVQIMADALSYFLTKIKGNASKEIGNHWKK